MRWVRHCRVSVWALDTRKNVTCSNKLYEIILLVLSQSVQSSSDDHNLLWSGVLEHCSDCILWIPLDKTNRVKSFCHLHSHAPFSMQSLYFHALHAHAHSTQSPPVFRSTSSWYPPNCCILLSVTYSCSCSFFACLLLLILHQSFSSHFFSSFGLLHLQSGNYLLCCVSSFLYSSCVFLQSLLSLLATFCALSSAFFHSSSPLCFASFSPHFLSFVALFFCL